MTVTAIDLFGASSSGLHPVGGRIALWVADIPAKALAREFGVAEQTAKNWRQGRLPLMDHFSDMVEMWREPFLDFVFAPVLADLPDLVARLDAMERRAVNFGRELADIKQQVKHEQMADRGGRGADADGGSAGSMARPRGARGTLVSRAIGLGLLIALVAPVFEAAIAPPAYASVADLDGDGDDDPARLPRRVRTTRVVRIMLGQE